MSFQFLGTETPMPPGCFIGLVGAVKLGLVREGGESCIIPRVKFCRVCSPQNPKSLDEILYRRIKPKSYDDLRKYAVQMAENLDSAEDVDLSSYCITLYWIDAEGDKVLIGSNEDFTDMCSVNLDVRRPVKIMADVRNRGEPPKYSTCPSDSADSATQTASSQSRSTGTNTDSGVAKLHTVLDSIASAADLITQHVHNVATAPSSIRTGSNEEDPAENRPFVHLRHTCDGCLTTPIIGKRFHATNLPDYDLCERCRNNYKGSEITFEVVELDRDRVAQDRWHQRHAKAWSRKMSHHGPKMRGLRGSLHRSYGHPPFYPPHGPPPFAPPHGPPHPFGPPHGPPDFGPPHGPPDFGPPHGPPDFGPPHGPHHGPHHFGPPHGPPPFAPPHGPPPYAPPHGSPPCVHPYSLELFPPEGPPSGPPPPCFLAAPANEPVDMDDLALNEAIRRSLQETKIETKETKIETAGSGHPEREPLSDAKEPIPSEEKKPAQNEDNQQGFTVDVEMAQFLKSAIGEIEGGACQPSTNGEKGSEANHACSQDSSFASDAMGEGDVAAVLGETLDRVAEAINEMNLELDRTTVSFGNETDSDDEAEIVVAPEGKEADPDDASQGSWAVVAEEEQGSGDEALARAAYMIGSALFNSDMARSAENLSTLTHSIRSEASSSSSELSSNSVSKETVSSATSVPTLAPTLTTERQVPAAVLARWSSQLRQLHELGFHDEVMNVDILERLIAANIGVGSNDEVTVQQFLHVLLKDV